MAPPKRVVFMGDSLQRLRDFPENARRECGFALVREIRVRDASGAFRLVYATRHDEAVYVLHAFKKKTQETAKRHIDIAVDSYRQI